VPYVYDRAGRQVSGAGRTVDYTRANLPHSITVQGQPPPTNEISHLAFTHLAANPADCTLAYWYQARFSSGKHGSSVDYDAFWRDLYAAGAEVVLNGHDHDYERFAPQDPDANEDRGRGIREFVVGTGGNPTLHPVAPIANTEVINNNTWGVLRLTLRNSGYDWQFLRAAGGTFTDSGSQACH